MRNKILETAIKLAIREGYENVRRKKLAVMAHVAGGSVNRHFGTMSKLRDEVVRAAIAQNLYPVIAQALVAKHPLTENLSAEVKRQAARYIAS